MRYRQYLKARLQRLKRIILKDKKRLAIALVAMVMILSALVIWWRKSDNPEVSNDITTVDVTSQAATVNNQPEVDPANADTTLNWTKSVDMSDDDLAVDGTITEEIDENQKFVGNLSLPKGWTAEYSTDDLGTPKEDRTFSAYDMTNQSNNPLEDITYIKIDTGTTEGVKPYADSTLVRPLDAKQIITDGKTPSKPILFEKKLYYVMKGLRISSSGSYNLDCFDLVTYARCVNGANANFFPTYFSSTGASATSLTDLGTGTKNVTTATNFQFVVDDGTYGHNGRVYMPGQIGNNYGVVCFDLSSYKNCGFTTLGSAAAPTGTNPSWLNGFVQSGSKIYGHANDPDLGYQTVLCFDIRDPADGGGICPGYTSSTTAATPTATANTTASTLTQYTYEHNNNYDTPGSQVMDGNKMYWTVNYRYGHTRLFGIIWGWDTYPDTQRDLGTVLSCYDVVARTKCSGIYNYNWPRVYDGSGGEVGAEYASSIFMWKQNGSNHAVCYTFSNVSLNQSPVESRIFCHSLTDGSFLPGPAVTAPAILPVPSVWQGPTLPGSSAWRMSSNTTTITDTDGHTKTYFAYVYGSPGTRGAMSCFDWDTQAHCSGMPWLKYWYNMNDANSADEGYVYDGSCMFGLSQQGYLWSFNPKTSESPCRVAGTRHTVTIDPDDFYCDGQPHAFAWGSARLSKASLYDFQNYNVRVYDSLGGNLLGSGDIKTNGIGKLDLSDEAFQGQESLYIDVDANVWNSSPWANSGRPYSRVQADAADVQYCYQTRAKTYAEDIACDATSLVTGSDAVFVSDENTYTKEKESSVPYIQLPAKQCFKDLEVSVTSDKSKINNGDQVVYTIAVGNKANKDTHNRGDVGGLHNPKSAVIEATIPSGMQFVSASGGGTLSEDETKVVWQNQAILAAETEQRTVTLRAPGPTARGINKKPVATLAASQETSLNMVASAIYDDDVDQSNNSSQNSQVTFENNLPPVLGELTQSTTSPRDPATLTFTITATDENNLSDIVLLSNNDILGSLQPTANQDEYQISINNVDEGSYDFSVRATDDGTPNLSTTSNVVSLYVAAANTAPGISNLTQTISSPRYPSVLTFTANVADDNSVGVVELRENGQKVADFTETSTPGRYQATVSGYSPGDYDFTVYAEDQDSPKLTTTSSPLRVTMLPNLGPQITGLTQLNSGLESPASLRFRATVTDTDGLASVTLRQGGNNVGTMTPTGTANQFGITLNNYTSGTYEFTVRATDSVSPAATTDSSPLQVVVAPNTPPSVSDLTQTTSSPRAPATLSFNVSASDSNGLTSVKLYSGQTLIGTMNPTSTANKYSLSVANYAAGTYSFSVIAQDANDPAASTQSDSISVTVDAPIVIPDPDPLPANKEPVISDFKQTTDNPVEPGKLNFVAKITDDSVVASVELLVDNELVGVMSATTEQNQYSLTLNDYKAGKYKFKIRTQDNGSPVYTVESETLEVTVGEKPILAAPAGTDQPVEGQGSTQRYTPLAIRKAIPSVLEAAVEKVFQTADSVVKPISPQTAKVLPYTTIFSLGGFAVFYLVLALRQGRSRLRLRQTIKRFQQTEASRKQYIDLISHYINTPITTMQSALELLVSKKSLGESVVTATQRRITRLKEHASALLDTSTSVTEQSSRTALSIDAAGKTNFLKSAGFIAPVLGVMVAAVMMNLLFVWSKKYGNNFANFAAQISLYAFGAVGLALSYSLMRREEIATGLVNQELSLEKSIAASQTNFIQSSGGQLAEDVTLIQSSVAAMKDIPEGRLFANGLTSLEKVVSKFSYLDKLLNTTNVSDEPISLDISLQSILGTYKEAATAKNIDLIVHADSGLAACIDEAGFRQLVGSLLDNAIKFTPEGGEASLSITKSRNNITIKVKDNGVGIDPTRAQKLFQPFTRGTDTKTFDYDGLGLDLYMDRLIVDRWNGTIKVSSKEKAGTLVTATLRTSK